MDGHPRCRFCVPGGCGGLGFPGGLAEGEAGTGCSGPPPPCSEGAPGGRQKPKLVKRGVPGSSVQGVPWLAGGEEACTAVSSWSAGRLFHHTPLVGVPRGAPYWAHLGGTPENGVASGPGRTEAAGQLGCPDPAPWDQGGGAQRAWARQPLGLRVLPAASPLLSGALRLDRLYSSCSFKLRVFFSCARGHLGLEPGLAEAAGRPWRPELCSRQYQALARWRPV